MDRRYVVFQEKSTFLTLIVRDLYADFVCLQLETLKAGMDGFERVLKKYNAFPDKK
jgi:hypothetical protein